MAPPSAQQDPPIVAGMDATVIPTQEKLESKEAAFNPLRIPRPPTFEDPYVERKYQKRKLAAAFRIFAKYGFDEGVAGHITLRDPVDKDCFWVNPFGLHFSLIKPSDLILVNHSGKVIGGGPNRLLNTAAYAIHSQIHHARPDVNCAAHSHSVYGRSFCALGKKLDCITQDSCAFYDDHIVHENFNGVVLAEEEGRNIANSLGRAKAAMLQNHGLLTVGETIEAAVFWFISLDKCCHAQLLADAAGKTIKIDHEDAVNTWKNVGSTLGGWFSGKPLFDVVEKESGHEFDEDEEKHKEAK